MKKVISRLVSIWIEVEQLHNIVETIENMDGIPKKERNILTSEIVKQFRDKIDKRDEVYDEFRSNLE